MEVDVTKSYQWSCDLSNVGVSIFHGRDMLGSLPQGEGTIKCIEWISQDGRLDFGRLFQGEVMLHNGVCKGLLFYKYKFCNGEIGVELSKYWNLFSF
jgi:hypothetical protein